MLVLTDKDISNPLEGLNVIDLFGIWCGPCRTIAPKLEVLAKSNPKIKFYKIDVDESPNWATKFKITCMPTILFIKDGKVLYRTEGADMKEIEGNLNKLANLAPKPVASSSIVNEAAKNVKNKAIVKKTN